MIIFIITVAHFQIIFGIFAGNQPKTNSFLELMTYRNARMTDLIDYC